MHGCGSGWKWKDPSRVREAIEPAIRIHRRCDHRVCEGAFRKWEGLSGCHRPSALGVELAGESQLVVRAVQRELAMRGYDVGPVDGQLSEQDARRDLSVSDP